MQYALLTAGSRRMLVTRPDTHAYGNAILNMAWSFRLARELEAALCVAPLAPERLAALTTLECDGVRRVDAGAVMARAARGMARLSRLGWPWPRVVGTLAELGPQGRGSDSDRGYFGLDFRHLAAASGLPVRLSSREAEAVAPVAERLGLLDARIVTLHVREAGHAAARGVQDRDKDTARNARIGTYRDAVDWLVARGYRVVRIGDPTMTPVARPGLVDLATTPGRTLALELWCVLRSAFLVASDSGPFNLSVLTGVPSLGVNITHLLGAYPLRSHDRMILKHVTDTGTGRRLSLGEMLTPGHMKFRWAPGRFHFEDNTPGEILAAVEEMAEIVEGRAGSPSADQQRGRQAIVDFLDGDWGRRKQKGAPFYPGDGFFGAAFAAASLGGAAHG